MSSKEWQSTERHFCLCDQRISAILEKVTSLYKEGSLHLEIEDESQIKKGLDVYFSDMTTRRPQTTKYRPKG